MDAIIKKRVAYGARLTLLLLFTVIFLFPFVWIILTSLKPEIEIRQGLTFLPSKIEFKNYIDAWNQTNFARQFLNSFIMAASVAILQIFTSLLAGYVFARIEFKGKNILFVLVLATLIIPYQLLVMPIFVMFSKIGLLDTFAALILPSAANAFGIFLFKQHFEMVSPSIEEAASIDGASRWQTLWQILFPLARGPAVTLFLLTFIAEWNDLFKPLVFTQSENMRTVQLGLTTFQEQFTAQYSKLTAAVVFVTLPVLILFFIGQKQFIAGIAAGGGKED